MIDSTQLLVGDWTFKHFYPSNKKPGTDEVSVFDGKFQQNKGQFTFSSKKSDEGEYLFARMTVNNDLATGVMHEHTSPKKEFKGAIYTSAFQGLLNKDCDKINGKWVGVGNDSGKRKIYTGKFTLEKHDSNHDLLTLSE